MGIDSPVNVDSSIFRFTDSINLKSAGMILPVSRITISPTTKSSEFISIISLSRLTRAFGDERFLKLLKIFQLWILEIFQWKH